MKLVPPAGLAAVVALGIVSVNSDLLTLQFIKGRSEGEVLYEKWNSFSRVTALPGRNGGIRLLIDSGAATRIVPASDHSRLVSKIFTPALHLKRGGDILIIGPGGGQGVAAASELGFQTIKGVELNPIIVDLATNRFRDLAGDLYDRPGVEIVTDEGRSYLRHSDETYDVLMLTDIDTWAATASGAFTLAENHLYTVEAFRSYLDHLKGGGILSITRWYFPERPHETLRLLSIAFSALEELGVEDPSRHCVVIAEEGRWPHANFLMKSQPFTDNELSTLGRMEQDSRPWKFIYHPDGSGDSTFQEFASASDRQAFVDGYDYDVSPPTDDRPFFFYVIRPGELLAGFKRDFYQLPNVTNIGVFLLVSTFILNGLFMLLVSTLPLFVRRRGPPIDWKSVRPALGYFACLGAGFIIVELTLMQSFILFLGRPTLALTVVLFTILLASGCGSRYSGQVPDETIVHRLRRWLCAILLLGLLLTVCMPWLFDWAIGFPLAVRIALSILVVTPLGFFLGTCFPSGIRLLGSRKEELLPWVWAINGSMSVVGSSLAMLVAMNSGFQWTLLLGLGTYVIAVLLVNRMGAWVPQSSKGMFPGGV